MPSLYTPLDLEIQDFSFYDLIIDARSPREFNIDHIPGARNYPVVNNDEFAEVGTLHRKDTHGAYVIGVTHSLRNMANWIEAIAMQCSPSAKILVYCFRGGKRSKLWSDTLKTIGYRVDVLQGGWKNYRRWVINGLEVMPRELNFKVIAGPTGCGKTRLLYALERQGAQILDLEGLANHRGSLLGAIPGSPQPTQKSFDSALLDRMRLLRTDQPVFIESESKKIGNLQLPGALMEAMRHADLIRISSPLPERIKVWEEDFAHFVKDPSILLERVQHLSPLLGHARLKIWNAMAQEGNVRQIFEELMTLHYDPAYVRSDNRLFHGADQAQIYQLNGVDEASMDLASRQILQDQASTG